MEQTANPLRNEFPILSIKVNDHPLIYLDNAATMHMPRSVIERMEQFYRKENANIHRGIHSLSEHATECYENVRDITCRFLDAEDPSKIVFSSGTTASINMAALMLEQTLTAEDEILITQMEHHSNYLPWIELAKRKSVRIHVAPVSADGTLDMDAFYGMLSPSVRIVALTECSNVTGITNPINDIIRQIRKNSSAFILIDGAQGVVHCRKSVREMKPDFYCFSGHKLGAPAGTGILYMSERAQTELRPVWFGGGTVSGVVSGNPVYYDAPAVFEAGTPNYAGMIGFGEALCFWMEQEEKAGGKETLYQKEQEMLVYLEQELHAVPGVRVLGISEKRRGCLSFAAEGVHPYDICKFLDQYGIAARSGHHCAQPYLHALGCEYAARLSVAPYNTKNEMIQAVDICKRVVPLLRSLSSEK